MQTHSNYDKHADVLYFATEGLVVERSEDAEGLIWGYDVNNKPIAVTIIGFKENWFAKLNPLKDKISRTVGIERHLLDLVFHTGA